MQRIDGKMVAALLKEQMAIEVAQMVARGMKPPHLAAVIVGNDGASETYVANKVKACLEAGFRSTKVALPGDISQDTLLQEVDRLNRDTDVDGFIVQLPLPDHLSESSIIEAIHPSKDVDGFHPENLGRMTAGLPSFLPATPMGIVELIKHYGIETSGRHCVVVGRSNIVGRPVSILLSQKGYPGDATVTVCHSRSSNLAAICRQADILIAAIGQPGFITADMVKEGAVVIDVGTTRVPDPASGRGWRLRGDVDFERVAPQCSYITPVPGGVGPMTIISLMKNTLLAARRRSS